MNKQSRDIGRTVTCSLAIIACSLVVGAGSRPGVLIGILVNRSHAAQSEPVVVSDGLKLELVEIKHLSKDVIEVVVRNRYKKEITGVAAVAGSHQSFHRDYIYAETESSQKLATGAVDSFLYSPSPISGVIPQIVICGVVFGDRTSDGDQGEVKEILDKRFGVKIQLDRINPYLERLTKVKGALIPAELARVRRVAEGLSVGIPAGSFTSPGLEHGLTHGRAFILHYISKLETVLQNERIETFYGQDGELETIHHSGEEDFRNGLPHVHQDFKSLAHRL